MKEYTLEQAVNDCIDMWDWLRKHPDKGKDEYFEMLGVSYYNRPMHGCAMCEFCGITCRLCPMWGLQYKSKSLHRPCYADKKSYGGWADNSKRVLIYLPQQLANRRIYATEVLKKALNLKWRIRK